MQVHYHPNDIANQSQAQPHQSLWHSFFCLPHYDLLHCSAIGEFTTRKLNAFDPTEHITHEGVCNDTDHNSLHTKVFTIPWTKSSSTSEEVHWVKQDRPTDSLEAFNRHITTSDPPASSPLFTCKGPKGHQSMTYQSFVICLNKATQAARLNHVHGHSICIGATLEYLLHGVPFNIMKVKGQWASNVF